MRLRHHTHYVLSPYNNHRQNRQCLSYSTVKAQHSIYKQSHPFPHCIYQNTCYILLKHCFIIMNIIIPFTAFSKNINDLSLSKSIILRTIICKYGFTVIFYPLLILTAKSDKSPSILLRTHCLHNHSRQG